MSPQSPKARPFGAIIVAISVGIGAVFYLLLGLRLAFFDIPTIQASSSSLKPLPDWVPLVNGLLSLSLGLMYMILLRMVLARTRNAFPMVQAIGLVNIAIGLFRLPAGIIAVGISSLVLAISNSKQVKPWLMNDES
jgi:hypothetical protein